MVKKIAVVPTHSTQIPEQFDLEGATSFGGAGPLIEFALDVLRLGILFHTKFYNLKSNNATYSGASDLVLLVIGRILGAIRPEEFHSLVGDPFLAEKLRCDRLQDPSTLQRTLYRVGNKGDRTKISFVHSTILEKAMKVEGFEPYSILDMDSTVEIVYGEEVEGANVGYNPRAHGRRSYRPLLFTEGLRNLVIGANLREGDASEQSDLLTRLEETCDYLESIGRPVRFSRADCGFQGEDLFAFYERRDIGYACKIKKTSGVMKKLSKLHWTAITEAGENEEIHVAEFKVQLQGWSKERRIIAVRRRVPDPEQMYLPTMGWRYEFIVTSIAGDPWAIADFYNGRCAAENIIKELKAGYGIDQISTAKFDSNDVDLLLKVIAYNVMWLFRQQLLPEKFKKNTIRLLRLTLFYIPGVLRRRSGQFFVRLASWCPFQDAFAYLRNRLEPLRSG